MRSHCGFGLIRYFEREREGESQCLSASQSVNESLNDFEKFKFSNLSTSNRSNLYSRCLSRFLFFVFPIEKRFVFMHFSGFSKF